MLLLKQIVVKYKNIVNLQGKFIRQLQKQELIFTQEFSQELEQKLKKKVGQFLRLSVDAGEGCKGFKYNFKFDGNLEESDAVVYNSEKQAVFAIDDETLALIQGATIDYHNSMIRQAFEVQHNPNAESSCSCKVSFSPKDFS